MIDRSEEKVRRVLQSLDRKSQEKEPAAVPYSVYHEEMNRLEKINRRTCNLAFAGWGISVLCILVNIVLRLINK